MGTLGVGDSIWYDYYNWKPGSQQWLQFYRAFMWGLNQSRTGTVCVVGWERAGVVSRGPNIPIPHMQKPAQSGPLCLDRETSTSKYHISDENCMNPWWVLISCHLFSVNYFFILCLSQVVRKLISFYVRVCCRDFFFTYIFEKIKYFTVWRDVSLINMFLCCFFKAFFMKTKVHAQ